MKAWAGAALAVLLPAVAGAQTVRQLALNTTDLIYDPTQNLIYASVTDHRIAIIDPVSGSIGPFVSVAGVPGRLAISDDGQFLYVGLDDIGSIARIALSSLTVNLQIALGRDPIFPG